MSKGGIEGTPLQIASRIGYADVVEKLLSKNIASEDLGFLLWNHTALYLASVEGHQVIVQLLIKKQPKLVINHWNPGNRGRYPAGTALYGAAVSGHTNIVRILLEAGADPNVIYTERDHYPFICHSSLAWACYSGDFEMTKLLLDYGADPNITATNFYAPLQTALSYNFTAIVDLLLQKGARMRLDGGRLWKKAYEQTEWAEFLSRIRGDGWYPFNEEVERTLHPEHLYQSMIQRCKQAHDNADITAMGVCGDEKDALGREFVRMIGRDDVHDIPTQEEHEDRWFVCRYLVRASASIFLVVSYAVFLCSDS